MLASITSIKKSSILTLDADQIQAAKVYGKSITAVWKINDDVSAIQIDGVNDPLYYWQQGKWVHFTPLTLRSTNSLARSTDA